MNTILIKAALMISGLIFGQFAMAYQSCTLSYKLLEDQIFYYELSVYDSVSQEFKSVRQWECDDSDISELPTFVEETCNFVNLEGMAVIPDGNGSFRLSLACG